MLSLASTPVSRPSPATRRLRLPPSSPALRLARLPSPARIAALETQELTTWAGMLIRRRGLLMSSLAGMTIPDLVTELAQLQWELVVEKANAVYHWARVAVQNDRTARAKYEALRARGHGYARALRSVADRLLNVACAMLRDGTLFDASLHMQNPLAKG